MKRRLLLLCLIVLSCWSVHAQFFLTGEDPSRLSWSQLRAGSFRLIYPSGLDSVAFRYARLFETQAPLSMKTLGISGKGVPVVLHTNTVSANGLVSWAPSRMELFTIPDPEPSALPWDLGLVLHESRHVAQLRQAGRGPYRYLSWLLGEQAPSLSAGILSLWSPGLFEGDAVMAETAHSLSGRGRQADFLLPYKTLFADSVRYSYDKWHFGSFRNEIPGEYQLGYLKQSAGRYLNRAGLEQPEMATSQVFEQIVRHPLHYRRAWQRGYGLSQKRLWEAARQLYSSRWQAEAERKAPFDSVQLLLRPERDYVEYASLFFLGDTLYAHYKSQSEPSWLVALIPGQRPRKIRRLGYINSSLCAVGDKVYWTEQVSGLRWAHENYSVLREYDVSTGKARTLLPEHRVFNPQASHDGRYLAMASYTDDNKPLIGIFDLTEEVFKVVFSLPRAGEPKEFCWNEYGLFASILTENGLGVWRLDLDRYVWQPVIAAQHRLIDDLTYQDGQLYFISDLDGTDNLYRFDLDSRQLCRLTNARFGISDPSFEGDSLYMVSYSRRGYEPAVMPVSALRDEPADFDTPATFLMDEMLEAETPQAGLLQSACDDEVTSGAPSAGLYEVKPYRKWEHLFRLHSWAPFYYDKDELSDFTPDRYYDGVAPGLTLISQNDLGTSYGQLGYAFYDGYHVVHARYTYSGWWPVISLRADYNDGEPAGLLYDGEDLLYYRIGRRQLELQGLAYVPLTWISGGWERALIPTLRYSYNNGSWQASPWDEPHAFHRFRYGLQGYVAVNTTARDLFPRWGLGFKLERMRLPSDRSHFFSQLNYASLYAYFPGVMRNQAFRLTATYQQQRVNGSRTVLYIGSLMNPRGMALATQPRMMSLALDYAFTVNLDLSVPGLLYAKRLELQPFVEWVETRNPYLEDPRTPGGCVLGLESLVNFHPLRMTAAFSAGCRTTWSKREGLGCEVLVSVPYL
ncbi:MAG: hypothetical protein IJ154_06695 [Bacteroidales bacterium]|nr:hypothetical protein [Bacteroidales bacterium]